MTTADRITAAMRQRGLDAPDLAEGIRVSRQTAWRYMNGDIVPSLGRIRQIARFIGVDESRLLPVQPVATPRLIIRQEGCEDVVIPIRGPVTIEVLPS